MDVEITDKRSPGRPHGDVSGRLRLVSLIASVAGAGGSVGLMFLEGHPPIFLRILFAIWVISPFVLLLLADMFSKRWAVIVQKSLYVVMLAVTLISLAIYCYFVFRPHEPTPTAPFVIVPPVSWLFIAIVVTTAALISRKRSTLVVGD